MLKESLARHLSDVIKNERAINDRFPWIYLRDLYQLLLIELTMAQQQLDDEGMRELINKVVKAFAHDPLSLKDYFHADESHRKQLFKRYLRQRVTPLIMYEMHDQSKKTIKHHLFPTRRSLFKRIFGLV